MDLSDLFRRIFDISPNRNEKYREQDSNQFRDPWDEIFGSTNFFQGMNPKDDPSGRYDADNFSGCYGGGPHNGGGNYQPGGYGSYDDDFGDCHGDMTPPPPPPHYMPSVFGQMDEMFRHLDNMMRGMHLGPGQGAGIQGAVITEIEEETADGARNPRDAMLKNPDSSSQRTPQQPPQPHHPQPHHPPPVNPQQQYEGDDLGNFGAFGAFGGFGKVVDPFRMMEDFFRVFEGRPAIPHLPGPDQVPVHPRDSAVKKDTDLDDSAPCGMGHLLDEGPKYEGTNQGSGKQGECDGQPCPGNPQLSATQQPGAANQPTRPELQTRFHSTSVIRVRKPDGSIEETRKYRDHTGREEVTVQRKEPDELAPGVIQPVSVSEAKSPPHTNQQSEYMHSKHPPLHPVEYSDSPAGLPTNFSMWTPPCSPPLSPLPVHTPTSPPGDDNNGMFYPPGDDMPSMFSRGFRWW